MKCDDAGPGGCEALVAERIRYFTGRHMTARDFRDEDAYHRTHRHLHNRLLHGWGVVCGLEVLHHPRPECRRDRVVVRCGLALDCCGREVVVPRDDVAPPIPWETRPKGEEAGHHEVLLLCLRFTETCVEKTPVLYSPEACSSPAMEDGRIREGYELAWRWVREEELDKYGWRSRRGCPPPEREGEPEKPCPEERAEGCCLDPACPPHHCVPLAVLVRHHDDDHPHHDEHDHHPEPGPEHPFDIDTAGRPSVAQAREHLTHICWISWPHGGVVKASDLHSLRVRFDRPLREAEHPNRPGPRGINERTFVVQYGEQMEGAQVEDLDFVEFQRPPHLLPDRRTAIYEIERRRRYPDHVIHVTLRCDFIVDCHGNPVDGDHLRGRLPTGNGTPGGLFESWFRVVNDADYDRAVADAEAAAPAAEE
jgi:hypothetical protein